MTTRRIDYEDHGSDTGYRVDIRNLLFTAERDYLVKNNGQKVKLVDLKDKTIVLFMFPLDHPEVLWGIDHPDMIDAYEGMLRKGRAVEFVLVPVALDPVKFSNPSFRSLEHVYDYLFSTIPFPAIPFSDVSGCGSCVLATFSPGCLPYWVVIDPNQRVLTNQYIKTDLFKLYGGDELYPLTPEAIEACRRPANSRLPLITKCDQLLGDFLLKSNGEKVPVSSLKDKIIGLYFCESIQHPPPPRMEKIKRVYQELKLGGYPFEIVQINFHYHFFCAINVGTDPTVEPCREDISWLTLPFKDPRCRKLQRIFNCSPDDDWDGDCLVIVDMRQDPVVFEFSGAEMIEAYGVQAYPFTRFSLYETEYQRQLKEVTLQSLFPPGEPLSRRSQNVGVSSLSGRRVLVLLADRSFYNSCKTYISNLKSKYSTAAEKDFEVVYVSTDASESSFTCYKGSMPWLVHPYSVDYASSCALEVFKVFNRSMVAAAAFDECGKLIAKDFNLDSIQHDADRRKKSVQFPFMSHSLDLRSEICWEVKARCELLKYYRY